jgi:hypothetical protein
MRSNNSSIKKHKAEARAKKRKEKFLHKLDKKNQPKKDFDSMIAYVDKFGRISSEPPEETGETAPDAGADADKKHETE